MNFALERMRRDRDKDVFDHKEACTRIHHDTPWGFGLVGDIEKKNALIRSLRKELFKRLKDLATLKKLHNKLKRLLK